MDFLQTRRHALHVLEDELQQEYSLTKKTFHIIDDCIDIYTEQSESSKFAHVVGLTISKAKHLSVGIYGLMLDGLAQEAGCLGRNFIEALDLLVYFRNDPSRIEQIFNDNLPSAGNIGKKIGSPFKNVREYFNENASHFSFSVHSFLHLVDLENEKFKKQQLVSKHKLKFNSITLLSLNNILIAESISNLNVIDYPTLELEERYNDVKEDIQKLRS